MSGGLLVGHRTETGDARTLVESMSKSHGMLVLGILVVAAVAVADAMAPGRGLQVLYVGGILLGLRTPRQATGAVLILAGLTSVLVLSAPIWNAGDRGPLFVVALLGAIWVASGFVSHHRRVQWALEDSLEEAQRYHEQAQEGRERLVLAQDELSRSQKTLEDMKHALDQSAIVATTDSAGVITHANDTFCEISKYPREELVGQTHRIINSAFHPPEFFEDLWGTISAGRIWRGEIRNRAKDGSLYWVDTTIVPFLGESGHPYQYIAIRHDISERKRVEAELREQAALTRLGQMAAVVAHELKNPLAGLRGALEIIGGRLTPGQSDGQIIKEMVARIDSLNQMVQDLLVFARPSSPKLEPVHIAAIVSTTTDLLRADPELKDVRVQVDGPDPTVSADPNLIRAVLLNLFINAAQAMGRKGTIGVAIAERDGVCEVGVADDGPGIPGEIRDRVFEPFFTTKHRGTGLGLPVARRTIELHGGHLQLECPPEGGTTVRFSLPLAR